MSEQAATIKNRSLQIFSTITCYKIIKLNVSFLVCGTSGGLAGIMTDIIYFPLDSIKTRLQVIFIIHIMNNDD